MCTSIAIKTQDFYFGRNMDLDYEFGNGIVITPRNYPFEFKKAGSLRRHYALIGMAEIYEGYPFYAEAVNEKGLCIACLNFPGYAFYSAVEEAHSVNISPFELVSWLLGRCGSVKEARELLSDINIIDIPFSSRLPLSPLHWHIADSESSIVLESTKGGIRIYDNPAGVLTNNPPFDFQMTNLCQYQNLITENPSNGLSSRMGLKPFGHGLGSRGLPGDYSPASRFVKASYLSMNSVCRDTEQGSVAQFFHLLDSVAMVRGSVKTTGGNDYITTYSCCINADKGIYYYKTYGNNQLTAVDMNREDLNADELIKIPLVLSQQILRAN